MLIYLEYRNTTNRSGLLVAKQTYADANTSIELMTSLGFDLVAFSETTINSRTGTWRLNYRFVVDKKALVKGRPMLYTLD